MSHLKRHIYGVSALDAQNYNIKHFLSQVVTENVDIVISKYSTCLIGYF